MNVEERRRKILFWFLCCWMWTGKEVKRRKKSPESRTVQTGWFTSFHRFCSIYTVFSGSLVQRGFKHQPDLIQFWFPVRPAVRF
jgi:hypothetical protein